MFYNKKQVYAISVILAIALIFANYVSVFPLGAADAQSSKTTPKPTQKYKQYTNKKLGFSVDYPNDWSRTEHLEKGSLAKGVSLSPNKNLQLNIGVIKNNNPYKNLKDQEILNDIVGLLKDACTKSDPKAVGFTCTEPQYSSSVSNFNGMPVYSAVMVWTKTSSDGTTLLWISAWSMMPSNNNLWIMAIEGSTDEFTKNQDDIAHIGGSFKASELDKKKPDQPEQKKPETKTKSAKTKSSQKKT